MIRAHFRINTNRVRENIEKKVILVQKKIAFQLLGGIVDMCPVDTGRARGNWQVTLGAPVSDFDWERKDKDGGPTKIAGNATIQSITTLGTIYLTNNLPYILALEKGHSRQAPAGMVQVTLDRVGAQF